MLHNMKTQKSENLWAADGWHGLRRLKKAGKGVVRGVTIADKLDSL